MHRHICIVVHRYDHKYEQNILDWMECHATMPNVLLLFYEDMVVDPRASLQKICDFIGVKVLPTSTLSAIFVLTLGGLRVVERVRSVYHNFVHLCDPCRSTPHSPKTFWR